MSSSSSLSNAGELATLVLLELDNDEVGESSANREDASAVSIASLVRPRSSNYRSESSSFPSSSTER